MSVGRGFDVQPSQLHSGAGGVRADADTVTGAGTAAAAAAGAAAGGCGGGPLAGALGRLQGEVGARSGQLAGRLGELATALDASARTYVADDQSAAAGLGGLPLVGPPLPGGR